jgi:glutamate 5-kinase
VLLTADDMIRRAHYRNAQRTLERLLGLDVLPVVNENDTVATDEIRVGDNDRLAALVAHIVGADALVLLSDVDGLYDGDPRTPTARLLGDVDAPTDLDAVSVARTGSGLGRGGMATKITAAAMAAASAVPVLLAAAEAAGAALDTSATGPTVGTAFRPSGGGCRRAASGCGTPPTCAAASTSTRAPWPRCSTGGGRCSQRVSTASPATSWQATWWTSWARTVPSWPVAWWGSTRRTAAMIGKRSRDLPPEQRREWCTPTTWCH